jgi:hypothetical protein
MFFEIAANDPQPTLLTIMLDLQYEWFVGLGAAISAIDTKAAIHVPVL